MMKRSGIEDLRLHPVRALTILRVQMNGYACSSCRCRTAALGVLPHSSTLHLVGALGDLARSEAFFFF